MILLSEFERREGRRREDTGVEEEEEETETEKRSDEKADKKLPQIPSRELTCMHNPLPLPPSFALSLPAGDGGRPAAS